LDFALSRNFSFDLLPERALSFLSICERLGNERFFLALLSALDFNSNPPQSSMSELTMASRVAPPTVSLLCDRMIDECVSLFHLYSINQLRCRNNQKLHRLLSSESLSAESRNSLLRLLIELCVDRTEFFAWDMC
jgi:hypothetical protein